MKKILTIFVALLIGFTASAQKKGDFFVVNSISFKGGKDISSIKGGSVDITNRVAKPTYFFVDTELAYFFIDRFAVTGKAKYGLTCLNDNIEHYFSINPGVRHYLTLITNKLFYTPGVNIAVGLKTDKGAIGFTCGINVDLSMLEYKPTKNIGIVLSLGGISWDMATFSKVDKSIEPPIRSRETEHNVSINYITGNIGLGLKFYF